MTNPATGYWVTGLLCTGIGNRLRILATPPSAATFALDVRQAGLVFALDTS